MFGFQAKASIDKYGTPLFALISFFVQGSSAISTASAIISRSSFVHIFVLIQMPSLSTRTGAPVIDERD
jgi:hypothetical protein